MRSETLLPFLGPSDSQPELRAAGGRVRRREVQHGHARAARALPAERGERDERVQGRVRVARRGAQRALLQREGLGGAAQCSDPGARPKRIIL